MGTIYDMESGRTEPLPAKNDTAAARDETIPVLAVRELHYSDKAAQAQAVPIHLIRALLKKG